MDGVKEEAERVGVTGEDARDRGRLQKSRVGIVGIVEK